MKTRNLLSTLLFVLLGWLSWASAYASLIYVTGSSRQFGTLDLQTLTYTQITANAGITMRGLARNNGTLYAVDNSANTALYRIGLDGSPTLIGSTGLWLGGLSFDDDGYLYAVTYNGNNLYRLDTSTGAATLVKLSGLDNAAGGSLAFSSGTLYAAADVSGVTGRLLSLSLPSGDRTVIGTVDKLLKQMALFDAGGDLYGISQTNNHAYSINTSTASLTDLGAISGASLPGNFTAAVKAPTPPTLALLAIASLGLGFSRKHAAQSAA